MDKKKLLWIGGFVLIAVVSIWLRLLYLNTDLWYDEACSWFSAKQSFPFGIIDNLKTVDLQHTPLYFFLLHFWMMMFGQGEVSMRILSLIFALGSIPLVYITSAKITSKSNALIATVLTAVSPLLVLFSVEVRMYPVVLFFVLLSLNYLIDFEQKREVKSLIKLVAANLLVAYTLTGGILYNISVFVCYAVYLYKNNKADFKKYLISFCSELVLLIPYFMLVSYYAKMRSLFVIKHEQQLLFLHAVDVIRNFFGSTIVDNIYWPSDTFYNLTVIFTLLVVVPCIYFVYGIIQGAKTSDKFLKTLYSIFIVSFSLSVVFSLFEVNVFTVRYILYLLPPFFILSVIGLSSKLSDRHFKIFITAFVVCSIFFNYNHSFTFKVLKTDAFKSVKIESDRLGLNADDIIIMPFGSDAPYYFRALSAPTVLDFDFHKQARNPYNDKYYDKSQQPKMADSRRTRAVYDAVLADKVFSDNYFYWFLQNVNQKVPSGRYVLIALYGSDAQQIVDIKTLRDSIPDEHVIQGRMLDIMFKKYLFDLSVLLNRDFNFVNKSQSENYTFFLYQKR